MIWALEGICVEILFEYCMYIISSDVLTILYMLQISYL